MGVVQLRCQLLDDTLGLCQLLLQLYPLFAFLMQQAADASQTQRLHMMVRIHVCRL